MVKDRQITGHQGTAKGGCPFAVGNASSVPDSMLAVAGRSPVSEDAAVRDRAALAGALDPIITIDASGTIQSASDSVTRVFGWKPAELLGRNVNVLMPEPHHSAHDGYLTNYRTTGKTNILNRTRRFSAVRKDGTIFPIDLSVSRAELPGGSTPLFVGIIRDVSEYVSAEQASEHDRLWLQEQVTRQTEALAAAQSRLSMADRLASIGTLAAGLGHDMNNVLLPVRARLNVLRAEGDAGRLTPAAREQVEEIRKSVAYLQQLADGLHFLAMDPEQDAEASGSVSLHEWWSQTGALIAKAVPKHASVDVSIPEDLPVVRVPMHRLTQAMLNLVVNAGEAIPAPTKDSGKLGDRGRVRVWADIEKPERRVRLGVTDNGQGMTPEVQRRAFDMFYTTKTRSMGTGLGLALVRKVAEQAGGSVTIDSEVGKGTTVTLHFPIAESSAGANTADAEAGGMPGVMVSVGDARAAGLIRQCLEARGVRVCIGDTPEESDVWIVDTKTVAVEDAQAWRAGYPRGRLVLLGPPPARSAAAWKTMTPFIIEDRDDFEAIRATLSRVVSGR